MAYKNPEDQKRNNKKYFITHREQIKEYKRKYYIEHREINKEKSRKYRLENKDKIKESQKKWKEAHKKHIEEKGRIYYAINKEKIKGKIIKYKYGITSNEYNELFEKQNECCAICGEHQSKFNKAFAVDHNHETGEVRGLLCQNCNNVLGHSK